METDVKEKLTQVLEQGQGEIPDYMWNILLDINKRDEAGQISRLSYKQRNLILKAYATSIEGQDPKTYRPSDAQTKYENCALIRAEGGYYINVFDQQIPVPTTKKEGVIILSWLNEAIPHMFDIEEDRKKQNKKTKTNQNKKKSNPF